MKIMDVVQRIIAAQRAGNINLPMDNRKFADVLEAAEREMVVENHVKEIEAYCRAVRQAGGTCRGCKYHDEESLCDLLGCKIGTPYSWRE